MGRGCWHISSSPRPHWKNPIFFSDVQRIWKYYFSSSQTNIIFFIKQTRYLNKTFRRFDAKKNKKLFFFQFEKRIYLGYKQLFFSFIVLFDSTYLFLNESSMQANRQPIFTHIASNIIVVVPQASVTCMSFATTGRILSVCVCASTFEYALPLRTRENTGSWTVLHVRENLAYESMLWYDQPLQQVIHSVFRFLLHILSSSF